MKLIFLIIIFSIQSILIAESKDQAKEPSKDSSAKTTDSAKKVEAKTASSEPAPKKKELPPLQKDGGFMVLDGVKWQADNIQKKSYMLAKEECEKNGMRLPTREELVDAYFSKYPEFRNPSGNYLSGNRVASNRSMLWYVNFDNGHHNHGSLTREYNVRCVKVEDKPQAEKKTSEEKK
jgi:hypothetical protein